MKQNYQTILETPMRKSSTHTVSLPFWYSKLKQIDGDFVIINYECDERKTRVYVTSIHRLWGYDEKNAIEYFLTLL